MAQGFSILEPPFRLFLGPVVPAERVKAAVEHAVVVVAAEARHLQRMGMLGEMVQVEMAEPVEQGRPRVERAEIVA